MTIEELNGHVRELPADPPLHFYLVADAAQDRQLPAEPREAISGTRSQCLLTHRQGADLEAVAPHLMTFPAFDAGDECWQWLARYGEAMPAAISVITSPLGFDELFAHLHAFTEVLLPDDETMIFAFWDPAILGVLVGQQDDATLHVRGPVLVPREKERFLSGIAAWWYWDRSAKLHQIVPGKRQDAARKVVLPLRLTQTQVDMLVEASVPDHVLAHIQTNKPGLLLAIPEQERYVRVGKHLEEARKLNLSSMQDIVNYVCAGLIYGGQMQESSIIEALLGKVRARQISLAQALEQFP